MLGGEGGGLSFLFLARLDLLKLPLTQACGLYGLRLFVSGI